MQIHKPKIILITLIIAISSLGTYISASKPYYKNKIPKIDPETQYKVHKILDGDTFQIKIKKEIVTVRMMGIDTPETVDPRKPVQCFGKEASTETKRLLEGKNVRLEIDGTKEKTDKFNRLLAYVYLDDGLFINKYLIENGYAHEYTYNIPYEKQREFKELEKQAREEKKGLWGDICND